MGCHETAETGHPSVPWSLLPPARTFLSSGEIVLPHSFLVSSSLTFPSSPSLLLPLPKTQGSFISSKVRLGAVPVLHFLQRLDWAQNRMQTCGHRLVPLLWMEHKREVVLVHHDSAHAVCIG